MAYKLWYLRPFFYFFIIFPIFLGGLNMVCFVATLMKILVYSETSGYIFMALLAVELLFSIYISLTLDTELVDGASELFWLFEYVGILDFCAASFAFSGLSYSLWYNACSKLGYSAYFLKLISVASFLLNEWSTTCTQFWSTWLRILSKFSWNTL